MNRREQMTELFAYAAQTMPPEKIRALRETMRLADAHELLEEGDRRRAVHEELSDK